MRSSPAQRRASRRRGERRGAEASVAAQRSALANRRMHEAVIEQASAAVVGAAAELARAKYDLDRYRTLRTDQFASRQRLDRLTQTIRKRGRRSAGRGRRSMLKSASSMSLPRKSSRPKPLSIKLWPSAISRCSILLQGKSARTHPRGPAG